MTANVSAEAAPNIVFALRIVGDVIPGQPASRTGYGQAVYGNTQPLADRATWIGIQADGKVTAFTGKVEYGQNIRTGLAIEVADELRVGMGDVEVVLGDTDRVPWDMGTFGSQTTARVGWQLRKAAATARETLLALAADRLDLPASALEAHEGTSRLGAIESAPFPMQSCCADSNLSETSRRVHRSHGRRTSLRWAALTSTVPTPSRE